MRFFSFLAAYLPKARRLAERFLYYRLTSGQVSSENCIFNLDLLMPLIKNLTPLSKVGSG